MPPAEREIMQELIQSIRSSSRLFQKRAISDVWTHLPSSSVIDGSEVLLGDDAAAIKTGDGYLLLAGEGVYPPLVAENPYLAGRTSVLTNISDIYAMGGRPVAVVDVVFSNSTENASEILRGIRDNAERYGVPVVGGHITTDAAHPSLAVFILGKAKNLLTSFGAQEGDDLVFIYNPNGKFVSGFNFWDSSSTLEGREAVRHLEEISSLADENMADTAKDVSMAGLIGSVLMLLESSGKGADINVESIPRPFEAPLGEWLLAFPSYGFVLSLRPGKTGEVVERFAALGLSCEAIGKVTNDGKVNFVDGESRKWLLWDFENEALTGI